MINTELFALVRDAIKGQPGRHDQSTWESVLSNECGTTRCVAGWAIHLTTGEKVFRWEPGLGFIEVSPSVRALAAEHGVQGDDDQDGMDLIPGLAASLLGLTETQADILFYAENEKALTCVELAADGNLYGFERALDLIEQGA